MKSFFNPKSVAVIGASRETGKVGNIIFDNLLSGFSGKAFPVNPNTEEVLGQKAYKTVLDIEDQIDLAVICVPAKIVTHVLESCGKKKIKYAIIISAGFSEAGISGKEKEKELVIIAKKHKVRVLGPNCLGLINNITGLNASFAASKLPGKNRVGFFSQSGAMGSAILDFANGNNFGFSYFVSLGNKSDISEVDLIENWTNDKNVEVAIGYLEDIKDGGKFMQVAKKFTAGKALIILKGGTTKKGEKAACSHTAALAQDEIVFEAAMEEAGVITARNMADLLELAVAFSSNKLPKSNRLAIISNAGGPSVLAADACSEENVEIASFTTHTIHEIGNKTQAVSLENPIDLRGDAEKSDFKIALLACQKDPNVDGILLIATPQAMTELSAIAWEAVWSHEKSKKPVYVNFIGGEIVEGAKEICLENGVPFFSFPERAVRAFRFQAVAASRRRASGTERKDSSHQNHSAAKSIIRFSGSRPSYNQVASILRLYGFPMADTMLVKNGKELDQALEKIKLPVILKISSPDVYHKTDVGGVMQGIETKEEAQTAYEKIILNIKHHLPKARIEGVTVSTMAKEGLELIIGAKRDNSFGPVVMFGFGGIFVELVADFKIMVAPFTEEKARKLVEKTRASRIIKGYRNRTNYNMKSLIDAILAVGKIINEHSEINQIEINPAILAEGNPGILGLDAKIEILKDYDKN